MRDSRAEAFDAFCNVQYGQLVGGVHLLCGDPGVAEELTQTALERAWSRWDRVSQMASPGGWVQQVAFNLARSRFRRRAAERRAYARHGEPQASNPCDDVAAHMVRQVLMVLPARQREVLVHRFYAGRSTAETAAAMGITPQGTARTPAEPVDAAAIRKRVQHRTRVRRMVASAVVAVALIIPLTFLVTGGRQDVLLDTPPSVPEPTVRSGDGVVAMPFTEPLTVQFPITSANGNETSVLTILLQPRRITLEDLGLPGPADLPDQAFPRPAPGEAVPEQLADGTPIWIVGLDEGVVVVGARSPHSISGLVGWCGTLPGFIDSPGAARFDARGAYRVGPAPTGLTPYEIRIAADTVTVLRRLAPRPRPDRATTYWDVAIPTDQRVGPGSGSGLRIRCRPGPTGRSAGSLPGGLHRLAGLDPT